MVFDIEPVHLKTEELDYELIIRNFIADNMTERERTSKLVYFFKQEKEGKRSPPGENSFPYAPTIDLAACNKTIDDITNIVKNKTAPADECRRAYSRLAHANLRLLRIVTDNTDEIVYLQRLKATCESLNEHNIWQLFGFSAKRTDTAIGTGDNDNNVSDLNRTINVDIGHISDDTDDAQGATGPLSGAIPKTTHTSKLHRDHVTLRRDKHRQAKFSQQRPHDNFDQSPRETPNVRHSPPVASSLSAFPFSYAAPSASTNAPIWPNVSYQTSVHDTAVGRLPYNTLTSNFHNSPNMSAVPQRHSYHGDIDTYFNTNQQQFRTSYPMYASHAQLNDTIQSAHTYTQQAVNNRQQSQPIDVNELLRSLVQAVTAQNQTQQRPQSHRRIPTNQWKATFSGDDPKILKTDTNLFDFLNMIKVYQRGDDLSDDEVLRQIPHLLSGSARQWYTLNYERFDSWDTFCSLLKRRFLSADHDSVLLSEIINNKQKRNEPIGNFIATMLSKFRAMANPPNESNVLSIIKANLSYDNAMAASMIKIASLEDLEDVIKNRESVRNTQLAYKAQMNTHRHVNEINSANTDSSRDSDESTEETSDVNALHNKRPFTTNKFEKRYSNDNKDFDISKLACFNCKQTGHRFYRCTVPPTRLFCFKCGSDMKSSQPCEKCKHSKNIPTVATAEMETA